jgi:hypothetical protein
VTPRWGWRDGEGEDPEACDILCGAVLVPTLRLVHSYAVAHAWAAVRALPALTGQAGIGCDATLEGCARAAMGVGAGGGRGDR